MKLDLIIIINGSSILTLSKSISSEIHFQYFSSTLLMSLRSNVPLQASSALKFFSVLGKLKTLKRTGWVNNGENCDLSGVRVH